MLLDIHALPYQAYCGWGGVLSGGRKARLTLDQRAALQPSLYVVHQARTPTIRASLSGGSGTAAMGNRDVRARRQAPPRANLRHSLTPPVGGRIRRGRRRETVGVDERRRDGFYPPCAIHFVFKNVFQIRTASGEKHSVFGTG